MASPQPDKYTKISNELYEQILKANFTLRELKIVLTVIRYCYGFQRKEAELSVRFISKATGIKFHHIANSIKDLEKKNILKISDSNSHMQGRTISFNKDYETWNFNSYRKSNGSNSYRKGNGSVTEKVTVRVTEKVTKKENNKENIKKELFEFNEFWDMYNKKVSKEKSFKLWKKLSVKEKEIIFNTLPAYIKSKPDKQYRKNPDTYLKNKAWNDEIIFRQNEKQNFEVQSPFKYL